MKDFIHTTAAMVAGAVMAVVVTLLAVSTPAQASGGTDCSSCHGTNAMPYVGQDKVHAALDAIPPMQALAPRPAIIPGGGGNVRNLGPSPYIRVNGVAVLEGSTSYMYDITDARTVQALNQNGRRDLKMWRMENVGGRMTWVYKGCRLGGEFSGAQWSIGDGDFAASGTSCSLG